MFELLPVPLQVIVCVLPAVQLSPPLGAVTVTVGAVTAGLIVKLALPMSSARMFPTLSKARTRIRAWLVFSEAEIAQLKLRALGL